MIENLKLAANFCTIYVGFFLFVSGMIGNALNIVVFTSLKTFRETSSAFYMNVTSAVNIVQLVVSLLSRILITGFNIDPTLSSPGICKIREYLVTSLMLISFSCMSFGSIDQYFSLNQRFRRFCRIRIAFRFVLFGSIVCLILNFPCFWFMVHLVSSSTNQTSCLIVNVHYKLFYSRFLFPFLLGFIPLFVRIFFGVLAFSHVHRLRKQNVPIVRVERDKQLTKMVLVEVVVDVFLTVPYSVYNHLYSSNVVLTDPTSIAFNQFFIAVIRLFFYGNFAIPFYIYFSVSSRFRKQVIHVLIEIHYKRFRENRVAPEPSEIFVSS